MNKLVAVLGIVIILLSVLCVVLLYQFGDIQSQNSELQSQIGQLESQLSELESQNLELQNQTNELEAYINKVSSASLVQITEFSVIDTNPINMLYYESNVSATVQNFGTVDVDGLTLWINDTMEGGCREKIQLGMLKVGEPQTVIVEVSWDIGRKELVATLMLDDIYLDSNSTTYW